MAAVPIMCGGKEYRKGTVKSKWIFILAMLEILTSKIMYVALQRLSVYHDSSATYTNVSAITNTNGKTQTCLKYDNKVSNKEYFSTFVTFFNLGNGQISLHH